MVLERFVDVAELGLFPDELVKAIDICASAILMKEMTHICIGWAPRHLTGIMPLDSVIAPVGLALERMAASTEDNQPD